ncbi:MAG: hypothetical protein ACPGYP_00755 [Solirubrobacterales bacterium]
MIERIRNLVLLLTPVALTFGIAAFSLKFVKNSKQGSVFAPQKRSTYVQTSPSSPIYRLEEPGKRYDNQSGTIYRTKFRVSKFSAKGRLYRGFGNRGTTETVKLGRAGENWDYTVVPLNDGRVAVFASLGTSPGLRDLGYSIAMFTSRGRLDRRFGERGLLTVRYSRREYRENVFTTESAVAIGRSGIALCGGFVTTSNLKPARAAIKGFGPKGEPLSGFGVGGTVHIDDLFPQADSKNTFCQHAVGGDSIVANLVTTFSKTSIATGVLRITEQGELDRTFGTNSFSELPLVPFGGKLEYPSYKKLLRDRQGRLLFVASLVGETLEYPKPYSVVFRLLPNGGLDPTFDSDGMVELPELAETLVPRSDGSLLIAGLKNMEFRKTRKFRRTEATIPVTMSVNMDGSLDRRWGRRGYRTAKKYESIPTQSITVRGRTYFAGPFVRKRFFPDYPGPPRRFFYVATR